MRAWCEKWGLPHPSYLYHENKERMPKQLPLFPVRCYGCGDETHHPTEWCLYCRNWDRLAWNKLHAYMKEVLSEQENRDYIKALQKTKTPAESASWLKQLMISKGLNEIPQGL